MENDGPRILQVESGPTRLQQMMGCERLVGYIGFGCLAMMLFLALYGQWGALKGVWLVGVWFGIGVVMYRRDPQYFAILIDKELKNPWPAKLYAAPGVCAPEVKIEPSCPVRGEAGAYGE